MVIDLSIWKMQLYSLFDQSCGCHVNLEKKFYVDSCKLIYYQILWIMTFSLFYSSCTILNLNRLMRKPIKWHVRPAKTQISLGIRRVWSESSLSAWRNLGSLATHWAHSEDSDQTGRMPRLIWVFAGRTCHFVGFVMRWLICWYLLVVTCAEVVIAHSSKTPDIATYNYSDIAVYACDTGYEQTGGSLTRICTASGTWAGAAPVCSSKISTRSWCVNLMRIFFFKSKC